MIISILAFIFSGTVFADTTCPTLDGQFIEADLRTGSSYAKPYLLKVNSQEIVISDVRGKTSLKITRGQPLVDKTPDVTATLTFDCRLGGFYLELDKRFVDGYRNRTVVESYPTHHERGFWMIESRLTASNPHGVITGEDFAIRELVSQKNGSIPLKNQQTTDEPRLSHPMNSLVHPILPLSGQVQSYLHPFLKMVE